MENKKTYLYWGLGILAALIIAGIIYYFAVVKKGKLTPPGAGGVVVGPAPSVKGDAPKGTITVDSKRIAEFKTGQTIYAGGFGDWWRAESCDAIDCKSKLLGYGAPSKGANAGTFAGLVTAYEIGVNIWTTQTTGFYKSKKIFGVIDTKTGETGVSPSARFRYFNPSQGNFYQILPL